MKIKTFATRINENYSFRINSFENIIKIYSKIKGDKEMEQELLKGGILLLYSLWEGFNKDALKLYIQYINGRQFHYYNSEIATHYINAKIQVTTNFSIRNIDILNGMLKLPGLDITANKLINSIQDKCFFEDTIIDLESNLNTCILKKNYTKLNLDISTVIDAIDGMTDKKKSGDFLDNFLKLRNSLSHGGNQAIDYAQLETFYAHFLVLINLLKTIILDNAQKRTFKK